MVAKNALESLSLTWGGIGDILIPTNAEGMPLPIFNNLLRAFDPDYICGYLASTTESSSFGETLLVHGDSRNHLVKGVAQTNTWCSPYQFPQGYFPSASRGYPIQNPLVPLTAFPRGIQSPMDLDLSKLDRHVELMVRMRFGGYTNGKIESLSQVTLQEAKDSDWSHLAEYSLTGIINPLQYHSVLAYFSESSRISIEGTDIRGTPMQQTSHGMDWIISDLRNANTWIVVVGDTCEDFCLALACDRMVAGATWLPRSVVEETEFRDAINLLGTVRKAASQLGADTIFTSATLGVENIEKILSELFKQDNDKPYTWSRVLRFDDLQFNSPKRLADKVSFTHVESGTCYIDEMGSLSIGTSIETPIPPVCRESNDAVKVSWEIDVIVEGSSAPSRYQLGPRDLLRPSTDGREESIDIRTGTYGLVYHSHRTVGLSDTRWLLEQHLVRPRVRIPGAADVIRHQAEAAGYQVRQSQTGRLNQLMIDLWGGLERVAGDMRGETWNLLSEFVDVTDRTVDGPRDNSLVIHGIPYLNASNVVALLSAMNEITARDALDGLLVRDILRRGLLLRCSRCNWRDWYSVDDIRQRFECKRCTHTNDLIHERWRDPVLEPNWYYDLDHAVREALGKGGRVPILALEELRSGSRNSFTYCTDFELVRNGNEKPELEIDFAIVRDGRIIIGEAKKKDRVENQRKAEVQKLTRLTRTASELTVDQLCFATLAPQWNATTKTTMQSAAKTGRIELVFMENLETLGNNQP